MPRKPRSGKVLPWNPRLEDPGGPGSTPPSASTSPPEKSGAEEHFYSKHMQRRTPVVVATTGGEELRGWIEWYDRDVIKLHSFTEANRFIAKSEIKYIFKHGESGDPQPVPTPPPIGDAPRRPRDGSRRRR